MVSGNCLVCFEADLLGQKRNEIREENREGRAERRNEKRTRQELNYARS